MSKLRFKNKTYSGIGFRASLDLDVGGTGGVDVIVVTQYRKDLKKLFKKLSPQHELNFKMCKRVKVTEDSTR